MKPETIVVVAGGQPSGAPARADCPRRAFVIAADGGVDRALALGLHVDLAIGDFDSVTPAGLARSRRRARGSSGTRPPRTRPTSSSRSTRRSRSSRPGSS